MSSGKQLRKNYHEKYPIIQTIFGIKIIPYLLLTLLYIVLIVPLIRKPDINTYDTRDEKNYHYPTILALLEQFPDLDLANYSVATTPLYHIAIALPALMIGSDLVQLRLISSIFSLCSLFVFYGYLYKRGNAFQALYFAILLLLSPYFLGPSIRLSTDNTALLLALLSIYLIDMGIPTVTNYLLSNSLILITILTRQIYAWLIGVFLFYYIIIEKKNKSQNIALVILPTLLPFAGLAYFIYLWGGLTSPVFSVRHTSLGINWDAPVYIISMIGVYGTFLYYWIYKTYKHVQIQNIHLVLLIVFAIGYLLFHPVSNEYPVTSPSLGDRGGALWMVASYLPNILSNSIVFWVFYPTGLVFLYLLWRYLASRHDYLILSCFSFWLIANMSNIRTYQKYYEPFLLFFLGYSLVTVKTEGKRFTWIAPITLILGFISITVVRFFN